MIDLGFTGSRMGMSKRQTKTLREILRPLGDKRLFTFRHGDCIGADEQAHKLAQIAGASFIKIHPPSNDKFRAYCSGPKIDVFPPREYLDRNKDIVDYCQILIAAPASIVSKNRSGTWATLRYANGIYKPTILLMP